MNSIICVDIHEVLPHAGSVKGGTLLTINGNGFGGPSSSSTAVSVDINGAPCDVIHHTPTQIQCWTNANDEDMSYDTISVQKGYRYKGTYTKFFPIKKSSAHFIIFT